MKDKVTSFETFVRLPWVRGRRRRRCAPTWPGRRCSASPSRRSPAAAATRRCQAVGRGTLPGMGAGLTVDDATKQAAVAGRARLTVSRRCRTSPSPTRSPSSTSPSTTRSPSPRGAGGRRGVLLVLALRVVLVGARLRGRVHLALALGRAVVRVVEARALEVHGDRVEHALHRRPALLARRDGAVAHLLEHLEEVSVLAAGPGWHRTRERSRHTADRCRTTS